MRCSDAIMAALLCLSATKAQDNPYIVFSFETGIRTFPAAGNAIATPLSGKELKQVYAFPQLEDNRIVLRRRFGPAQYGLYIGKRSEQSFRRLSAFRPPPGTRSSELVEQKFYLRECVNPGADMVDIYFDNEHVYAENATRLFYFEQGWKIMEMLHRRPCRLTVTSTPHNAQVLINGKLSGVTPLTLNSIFKPSLIVRVRKKGYHEQEAFVNLPEGDRRTRRFVLTKLGDEKQGRTYPDDDAQSLYELGKRITDLTEAINQRRAAGKQALNLWEKDYPPPDQQKEFEKAAVYQERKKLYADEKNLRKVEFVARSDAAGKKLRRELLGLTAYREVLEKKVHHRYLQPQDFEVGRYDPDSEFFPVTFRAGAGGQAFSFSGRLAIPIANAREFKRLQAGGKVKLYYRYRAHEDPARPQGWRVSYVYSGLMMVYRDREYGLTGEYEFGERRKVTME